MPDRRVTSVEEDEEHWGAIEKEEVRRVLYPHQQNREAENLAAIAARLRVRLEADRIPPAERGTPLPLDPAAPCPICHGVTYLVAKPRQGWNYELVPCQCRLEREAQQQRERLWLISNLADQGERTFENFPRSSGTQAAYEQAVAYAENPLGEHPWFLIVGPPHSGKTHLAAAIAREVYNQNRTVLFVTWGALCDWARAIYSPDAPLPAIEQLDLVRSVYLLVIDGVGDVQPTPLAQEKLYQLINHRYNTQAPTVYTLVDIDQGTIDQRLRSRMVDWQLARAVLLPPPPRPARPLVPVRPRRA